MKKIIEIINIYKQIKRFIAWLSYQYNSIWNERYYKKKCRQAIKLANMTGRDHYVVTSDNGLMVINKSHVKAYNKIMKHNKIDVIRLDKMSLYKAKGRGLCRDIK